MKPILRKTLISCATLVVLGSALAIYAQRQSGQTPKTGGKPRIVVFGTGSNDTVWTSNTTTATLEDALTQGGRYELITASQRDTLLQEQGFNNSDLVDPKQATKVGKLLSARYIIIGNALDVTASKTKVPSRVGGLLGGISRGSVNPGDISSDVKTKVQIQMIDAETGVIKLSKSYEEKISKDLMTKSRNDSDVLKEGYRKAMEAIAVKFASEMGLSATTEGLIVAVRGNRVALDLGSDQVQIGQEFEVYTQDDPIKNAAGEVLSYVTIKHARIRIEAVEPKLSWASVIATFDENERQDPTPNLSRIKVNYAAKQVK
ncbi:MAG: hypothetical protein HY231_26915 [Acidobacteria bacterium]|nr:hypothetical protein [Acidobacteriota bacterium]